MDEKDLRIIRLESEVFWLDAGYKGLVQAIKENVDHETFEKIFHRNMEIYDGLLEWEKDEEE